MSYSIWNRLTFRSSSTGAAKPRRRRALPQLEQLESRELLAGAIAHPDYVRLAHSTVNHFAGPGGDGYSPAQIEQAYGINQISFNGTAGNGAGTTIAIVDAYNDPNIASDLHQFDAAFGLPDPTLTVVNQTGGTSLPRGNTGWAEETSLDVEWRTPSHRAPRSCWWKRPALRTRICSRPCRRRPSSRASSPSR